MKSNINIFSSYYFVVKKNPNIFILTVNCNSITFSPFLDHYTTPLSSSVILATPQLNTTTPTSRGLKYMAFFQHNIEGSKNKFQSFHFKNIYSTKRQIANNILPSVSICCALNKVCSSFSLKGKNLLLPCCAKFFLGKISVKSNFLNVKSL